MQGVIIILTLATVMLASPVYSIEDHTSGRGSRLGVREAVAENIATSSLMSNSIEEL